jgi:photosystem II stability/assembly factor-like uncharacterized protein
MLNTNDGGKNWFSQTHVTRKTLRDVMFSDSQNGWAVGEDGLILFTNDGGQNWQVEPVKTIEHLLDVHVSKWISCIVGAHGTICIRS